MGTWGPGIFADDEAADARDNFRLYVADQQDVGAATDAIASDFGALLEQPAYNTAFWIGLALTQWAAGWLDPRVKSAALQVIDDGSDLAKWQDGAERTQRAAVLRKARQRITAIPPDAKRFPRPWPVQLSDFQAGEIIGRRLPNGRLAVLKVIGFRPTQELKVRGPAVRLQHWLGMEMPSREEAARLDYLHHPLSASKTKTFGSLVLTAPRKTPLASDMFIRGGIVVPLGTLEAKTSYGSVSTREADMDDLLTAGLERFWNDPTLPASALPPWRDVGGSSAPVQN